MNFISIECYYWVSLILIIIATIIIGIENAKIGSVGPSGFEMVFLAIIFCCMWPILIGFGIAALITVLPVWLIFQLGKWLGRTFLK